MRCLWLLTAGGWRRHLKFLHPASDAIYSLRCVDNTTPLASKAPPRNGEADIQASIDRVANDLYVSDNWDALAARDVAIFSLPGSPDWVAFDVPGTSTSLRTHILPNGSHDRQKHPEAPDDAGNAAFFAARYLYDRFPDDNWTTMTGSGSTWTASIPLESGRTSSDLVTIHTVTVDGNTIPISAPYTRLSR